jgi:hypothetical protein
MNDSHAVDNGQPSLVFPVIGTDDASHSGGIAEEEENLRFARPDVLDGDVVDTNWDIPKIDFAEDQPAHSNQVPPPPAFPPERTDAAPRIVVNESAWDTRLDLNPSGASEGLPVAPLFPPAPTSTEAKSATVTPQEEGEQRSLSSLGRYEDEEFLQILAGSDVDEQPSSPALRHRSRTQAQESLGKGFLWYLGCGALLGLVVVAAVVVAVNILQ